MVRPSGRQVASCACLRNRLPPSSRLRLGRKRHCHLHTLYPEMKFSQITDFPDLCTMKSARGEASRIAFGRGWDGNGPLLRNTRLSGGKCTRCLRTAARDRLVVFTELDPAARPGCRLLFALSLRLSGSRGVRILGRYPCSLSRQLCAPGALQLFGFSQGCLCPRSHLILVIT